MTPLDLQNLTHNQHFLSQAEQRLNAINPSAQAENQRIYEFDVVDRGAPILRLRSPNGRRIERSLSWEDLFSFDVSVARSNLEMLFQAYERDIARVSCSLLDKLRSACDGSAIKGELIDLFAMKLLNFLRNPYSVLKVLNTIGVVAEHFPTDPELRKAHDLVREGSKPQREAVCSRFGFTTDVYDRWLVALFNLLAPAPMPHSSIFDALIKGLFEGHYVIVQVHDYTPEGGEENVCLLSDRGFNVSVPEGPDGLTWACAFDFNISSRAFATFAICDPTQHPVGKLRPDVSANLRAQVTVSFSTNDVEALVRYNQLAVFQCAQAVFAAHARPRLQR